MTDKAEDTKKTEKRDWGFTMVYLIGAGSCWYHGTSFGTGLFWPWYIGGLFV